MSSFPPPRVSPRDIMHSPSPTSQTQGSAVVRLHQRCNRRGRRLIEPTAAQACFFGSLTPALGFLTLLCMRCAVAKIKVTAGTVRFVVFAAGTRWAAGPHFQPCPLPTRAAPPPPPHSGVSTDILRRPPAVRHSRRCKPNL